GVLEGRYFEENPTHVLGKPVGALAEGEDTPGPKFRRGFQIVGRFTGFPAWTPRPMEETEVVAGKAAEKIRGGIARERMEELPDDAPENLRAAVSLGIRADAHLAAVARGDAAKAGGGAELRRDLEAWRAAFGRPRDDASLAVLAETNVAIQRFMSLWEKDGSLTDLLEKDVQRAGYQGPLHLGSYADWLYRQTGGLPLPISKLSEEAERQGLGPVDTERVKSELWPLGWRIDNAARLEGYTSIEPKEAYLTGDLWPKHDRAKALAEQGDELAKDALSELRAAIGWTGGQAVLAQSSPNQPWIPLDILVRFARKHSEWPTYTDFARKDGLLLPDDGSEYGRLDNTDKSRTRGFSRNALCFIGWCNNDKSLFRPEGRKEDNGDGTTRNVPASELRKEMEEAWNNKWNEWLRSDDTVANALELAYNRRLRGYVPRTYSSEPMELARWGPKIRLHSYQNAGVRQLVENRCGLLALDVGLGKTFTGIATLAAARQQGWARRPVILSPNTICWSWYRDTQLCLPDYRIVLIGANRKKVSKVTGRAISDEEAAAVGTKGWRWRSTLDTPEQRAKKWTAFQAGLYDVAICTYTAFSRQQIDPDFVQKYVGKNVAIRRAITLSLDQAEEGEEKKPQKRTERSEADTQERVRAWVGAQLSPPKGWSYDPGIDWHTLGVDLLIVDEAQNFKNLYYSSRES
ncbi:MAG TPA: SNF2-related protein, partial [Myxococcota bacterium]|nr:SNF2-related protein [Myxococcota bacterium]